MKEQWIGKTIGVVEFLVIVAVCIWLLYPRPSQVKEGIEEFKVKGAWLTCEWATEEPIPEYYVVAVMFKVEAEKRMDGASRLRMNVAGFPENAKLAVEACKDDLCSEASVMTMIGAPKPVTIR